MKKCGISLVVIGLLVVGSILLNNTVAQSTVSKGPTKVAVCNVFTVFQNYQKAKDSLSRLEEKKKTIEAEVAERMKKAQSISDSLKSGLIKKGTKTYEEQLSQMLRIQLEAEAWQKLQTQLAMRQHSRLTDEMDKEIHAVVSRVAADLDIEVVMTPDATADTDEADILQKINRRTLLYWSDNVDITDEVLKRLNDAYKERNGG
ncbi:MAG: OmpH family outer membrane protein [Phycisphaerae bacterium]